MRLLSATSFAICVAGALAFKDTSPFLLFSTAKSDHASSTSQLQSRASVLDSTKAFLSQCPTDAYIVLQQAGVAKDDVQDATIARALKTALIDKRIAYSSSFSQVIDGIDAEDLVSYITKTCGSEVVNEMTASETPIFTLEIPRSPSLSDDKKVAAILGALPRSYTVIYTTTPPVHAANHPSYEPKFEAQEPLHVEMKRNVMSRRENSTAPQVPKNAPLFEKYQFFTPGLFMGIIVALLLLGILSIALRAISSLSVSYGAFDKEMGPAAQKKQQ